jgi:hypothetical protein
MISRDVQLPVPYCRLKTTMRQEAGHLHTSDDIAPIIHYGHAPRT